LNYQGEWAHPESKRFEEQIVFVPFYGAHKKQMARHREFVKSLGFDSFIIEHSFHPHRRLGKIPISRDRHWGVKHLWADEIEATLDAIKGPKIVYAFSNPASCAIEAIGRRRQMDVKALICDSGPFFYFRHCNSNRLLYEEKIVSPVKRLLANTLQNMFWSSNHDETLRQSLELLPERFRILSVRGGQDLIVPPWAIDAAFRDQRHLDLEILTLPEAGHLRGLKEFPNIYKTKVSAFLSENATTLIK
jgi:hypothetical protein